MAKKRSSLMSMAKKKSPSVKLSPEDLQEFNLRRGTLNNAKFQAMMVEEAYVIWSKNLRTKYGLPVKFTIHPQTGFVTPTES
jgi:hypothetical protein